MDQLVRTLLTYKMIAVEAGDFAEEILVKKRMQLMAEKELSEAWLQKIVEDVPEADVEAIAYEQYVASPETFMSPEAVDVTHILINNEDRDDAEALELAQSIRDRLVSGELEMDAAVNEYSDDPSKVRNGGRFPTTTRGQMVAEFEQVAFGMREEGEISEPVHTSYGYHIIRLNKRLPSKISPFAEVKSRLMVEARKQYQADYRTRYLQGVLAHPIELDKSAVETMAKRYFGEELELAPQFEQ